MKIGRNQPCPCGSGKKYKKCCLDKQEEPLSQVSKDYFRLKGENAEKVVHELAHKSFFIDWCYENPRLSNGNELCDLLVVFDDTAIIWQIKDLKLKDGKYNKREVDKNLRQLQGARRTLFDLKEPVYLENARKTKEKFNPETIKNVFLISALIGEGEDFFEFIKTVKDKTIHIFNREDLELILNELDTIKDFVTYMKEKEKFVSSDKKITLMGGEKDMLAYYLMHERSFKDLNEADYLVLVEGIWEDLRSKPEFIAKKEEDKISYGWDDIINRAHTCGEGYEKIAKELVKTNRFERRFLSKGFFEAHVKAHNETTNNVFRRATKIDGTTYCFLFVDGRKPRAGRQKLLEATCFVARGLNKENSKVVGIATEMKIEPSCSYDFCLVDIPEWGDKEQTEMERVQKELGIFTNPNFTHIHEDEYPIKDKKK